jgi:hypothetical protein
MRGKNGHRARSYSGFRGARVAPRGRMSARGSWGVYLLMIVGIALVVGLVWHHFHIARGCFRFLSCHLTRQFSPLM